MTSEVSGGPWLAVISVFTAEDKVEKRSRRGGGEKRLHDRFTETSLAQTVNGAAPRTKQRYANILRTISSAHPVRTRHTGYGAMVQKYTQGDRRLDRDPQYTMKCYLQQYFRQV